jgi:adenylate cyclase
MTDARLILPDGREHPLRDSCTLGRHPSNDLLVPTDHASRRHALIQRQLTGEGGAAGFQLIDLGSANGSIVNGRRVARPVPLKDGDEIDLAGYRMRFSFDTVAAAVTFGPGSTILTLKRRNLWLIVADIIGSTELSRKLPPEELPRVTGGWFKACREIVDGNHGHMNQYLGDGFFSYWEDDGASIAGLRTALREFTSMQQATGPAFRFVLHHGPVVLGSVPTLTTQNLHGPEVNFVFRLEKLAGSLGEVILLSDAAATALKAPVLRSHTASLSGFDGTHRVHAPDWPAMTT